MKAVFWAGVGTLFPFLMTITGAALVFLLKNQKEDGPCMGFAAGVMSAAAVFSMLLPAMRQEAGGWLTVTLGFAVVLTISAASMGIAYLGFEHVSAGVTAYRNSVTEADLATLTERLPAPCLGRVPHLPEASPAAVAAHLDLAVLLG